MLRFEKFVFRGFALSTLKSLGFGKKETEDIMLYLCMYSNIRKCTIKVISVRYVSAYISRCGIKNKLSFNISCSRLFMVAGEDD